MGIKYNDKFNIKTTTAEHLEIFCNSDKGAEILNSLKLDAVENIRRLDLYQQQFFIDSVATYIEGIPDVSGNNIHEAFYWFDKLNIDLASQITEFRKYIRNQDSISAYEYRFNNVIDILNCKSIYGCLPSQKVLLIDGNAGEGKSHLLGNFCRDHIRCDGKAILLLGHKFISSERVEKQIIDQLSLSYDFQEFLEIIEGIGERDNRHVVIIVDAINESRNKDIWFIGLRDIISSIEKLNFVKFVFSVRSTYEDLVLAENVKDMIAKESIARITHRGFHGNIEEAFEMFSSFYDITFAPKDYFNQRLENPLFMSLFCKTYSQNPETLLNVFDAYIMMKDKEIKESMSIQTNIRLLEEFINEVSSIFIETNSTSINESDLLSLDFWGKHGFDKHKYIGYLEQSDVLYSSDYRKNEDTYFFFSYQLMEEYFIAMSLLKKLPDRESVDEFFRKLLKKPLRIRSFSSGVFGIFSALYSEKFNDECISIFDEFILPDETDDQYINDYIFNFKTEYVLAYSLRTSRAIKSNVFFSFIEKNMYKSIIDNMWRVLFTASTIEGHPLNAKSLHLFLFPMSISYRYGLWTLYVNNLTSNEETIYNYIVMIQKGSLSSPNGERAKLMLMLFTWLLTSSNRTLRDNTSEAIIEILKTNFEICKELLVEFNDVNDPYVLQRLFGCILKVGKYVLK